MGKRHEGDKEIRSFDVREMRMASDDSQERKLSGYAAVFNVPSEDLGGFIETIAPGAFSKTLKEADVRAVFNHDPNIVLGRTRSGTLRLEEDEVGLKIEIDLPNTQAANDLITLVKRGDISQMSFAFYVIKESWTAPAGPGLPASRSLLEVALVDVAPVTYPAYPQTSVGVRAMVEQLTQHGGEPEQVLHSNERSQAWLDVQRKKLDLAEKANI